VNALFHGSSLAPCSGSSPVFRVSPGYLLHCWATFYGVLALSLEHKVVIHSRTKTIMSWLLCSLKGGVKLLLRFEKDCKARVAGLSSLIADLNLKMNAIEPSLNRPFAGRGAK
jgi:hypothetical protein